MLSILPAKSFCSKINDLSKNLGIILSCLLSLNVVISGLIYIRTFPLKERIILLEKNAEATQHKLNDKLNIYDPKIYKIESITKHLTSIDSSIQSLSDNYSSLAREISEIKGTIDAKYTH